MKYTKEKLEEAVQHCKSFAGVARYFGAKPAGGTTWLISKTCKRFNIDTSHFTGPAHQRGRHALNRRSADQVLILNTPDSFREKGAVLRRALKEIGREYKCEVCGQLPVWNNKPLILEVDHINGCYWDNRRENIRFICPHCHSQTEGFSARGKGKHAGMA